MSTCLSTNTTSCRMCRVFIDIATRILTVTTAYNMLLTLLLFCLVLSIIWWPPHLENLGKSGNFTLIRKKSGTL